MCVCVCVYSGGHNVQNLDKKLYLLFSDETVILNIMATTVYDTKPSDCEASDLELLGMCSPSLSLLSGPLVFVRGPSMGQIELFYHLLYLKLSKCVLINDWCYIELLVLHSNTWNHLTMCKQMVV